MRFMKSPAAAEYMKKLGFSEGYELLYAIAFGYPMKCRLLNLERLVK